jgi:hypothetical protein
MEYMRLDYPFSENFGKAGNRNEVIDSAQAIFNCLMKLAPGSNYLPYSILESVTEGENGTEKSEKNALLKYLFRADAFGSLSMIAFVQPCDWVSSSNSESELRVGRMSYT